MAEAAALTNEDIEKIRRGATKRHYAKDSVIFSEGDFADEMYFIDSGRVSIVIQEFTQKESVGELGPGEYFGEMAFFSGDRRSASVIALEDTVLHCIGRNSFLDIYERDGAIAARIDDLLAERTRQLALKETLVERPGSKSRKRHIGIKGDPSLRESAFTRERYESVADQYLPQLRAQLYDLLLNRSAYEISIHFNSGEVHVRTVLDPFTEGIHPANKLVNKGYVQRHFPLVSYEEKGRLVKRLYGFMADDPGFLELAKHYGADVRDGYGVWQPACHINIVRILAKLPCLRRLPNFYLRNFTISTVRESVRMQFNCDGVHILDAQEFESFLKENLPMGDIDLREMDNDRRKSGRRHAKAADAGSALCERRTPPGRRQSDWDEHIALLMSQAAEQLSPRT